MGLATMPWTFWLVLTWLAGSLLVSGHVMLGFLSLWSLQRRCRRLSQGEWAESAGATSAMLGVRRRWSCQQPKRTMPMTWGLWRTRLLLPAQAAEWPAEQRRAVLLHELGMAKRRDCLTQLGRGCAFALYWFNPLVWVAWRRIQAERERACDDLVLNTGHAASAYAEHLLSRVGDAGGCDLSARRRRWPALDAGGADAGDTGCPAQPAGLAPGQGAGDVRAAGGVADAGGGIAGAGGPARASRRPAVSARIRGGGSVPLPPGYGVTPRDPMVRMEPRPHEIWTATALATPGGARGGPSRPQGVRVRPRLRTAARPVRWTRPFTTCGCLWTGSAVGY